MYKVVFSDKPITEIKKKMHIDPIFTYSDSEIALKVCRNKQRFKFNRRPLCIGILKYFKIPIGILDVHRDIFLVCCSCQQTNKIHSGPKILDPFHT